MQERNMYMTMKFTQQDEDAAAVKLRQLLEESARLATLASRLFAETVLEKSLQKDLSEASAAPQPLCCAKCHHFQEPT